MAKNSLKKTHAKKNNNISTASKAKEEIRKTKIRRAQYEYSIVGDLRVQTHCAGPTLLGWAAAIQPQIWNGDGAPKSQGAQCI